MNAGRVHGTVELVGCTMVTKADLANNTDKHCVEDLSIVPYAKVFAWELANPRRFDAPRLHLPKQGARVWIVLEYPNKATQRLAVVQKAEQLESSDIEGINKCVERLRITHFEKSKKPYFKVALKHLDFLKKYEYEKNDFENMKSKALEAMMLKYEIGKLEDELDCLGAVEMKLWLDKNGLTKTGCRDDLQNRILQQKLKDHLCCLKKKRKMVNALPNNAEKKASPKMKLKGHAEIVDEPSEANGQAEKGKDDAPKEQEDKKPEKNAEKHAHKFGQMNCKYFVLPSAFAECKCRWSNVLFHYFLVSLLSFINTRDP